MHNKEKIAPVIWQISYILFWTKRPILPVILSKKFIILDKVDELFRWFVQISHYFGQKSMNGPVFCPNSWLQCSTRVESGRWKLAGRKKRMRWKWENGCTGNSFRDFFNYQKPKAAKHMIWWSWEIIIPQWWESSNNGHIFLMQNCKRIHYSWGCSWCWCPAFKRL